MAIVLARGALVFVDTIFFRVLFLESIVTNAVEAALNVGARAVAAASVAAASTFVIVLTVLTAVTVVTDAVEGSGGIVARRMGRAGPFLLTLIHVNTFEPVSLIAL